MRTKEDLNNDHYYNYKLDEQNKPVDSSFIGLGYLRRPTDRMITFGMFFQDYLSTNKNFRVYLNTLYGSNLPYNIPGSVKYRNALVIDPYIRVDLGLALSCSTMINPTAAAIVLSKALIIFRLILKYLTLLTGQTQLVIY
jgi:hypothetical protein